jgi:DNA mismatch endonuclease, patch repair protein
MAKRPRWASSAPTPDAWKVPRGDASQRSAEQDDAARGRKHRLVRLADGRSATASVALKQYAKTRRIYAYLRYSDHGKTITIYIGDATAHSREEALRIAWQLAKQKGLLDS